MQPDAVDEALDAEDGKTPLVELIVQMEHDVPAAAAAEEPLARSRRAELAEMKLGALHRLAVAEGVDEGGLREAMDSGDPKEAMITLILEAKPKPTASSVSMDVDRPHFGTKEPQRAPKPAPPRNGILPASKHAMVSYQWDDQERVIAARKTLTRLGCPCWMDIDGGMQHDIYESMAAGVENAACVVCFLSQKYQDSENCKLELKFAKQSGVPIVPVMAESTRGWRPSGWLGIVVAGSLWTPLGEGSDFDSGVRSLVEQIKGAVPGSGGAMLDDHDYEEDVSSRSAAAVDAGAELRAELERLRVQIEAHDSRPTALETSSFDADAPAGLAVGVPSL